MGTYPDVGSAGRSKRCPYIPGQAKQEARQRRLTTAIEDLDRLVKWAAENQVGMALRGEGQHWILTAGRRRIDWSAEVPDAPWRGGSSAKMVRDQQWARGVQVHDVDQLIRLAARHFRVGEDRP